MSSRTIRRQHPALRDDIGDLITRRPLPGPGLDQIDPFLFLNHHGPQVYPPGNGGLPFGPHPHRGFETVTFILDGELAHKDSGGHESIIKAGGIQWMTAGRGLVHAELSPASFMERGGALEILQLWVNLPSRLKMVQPRYVGLQQAQIPALPSADGRVTVNLISGEWEGRTGPVESLTGIAMMTLSFQPGGRILLPAPVGRNVFLYVVRGEISVAGEAAKPHHLVEMNEDGESVEIVAQDAAMVLFGHAEPLGEPVVAHGPFVMNSREEILQAIRDYQAGKFGDETVL
ncbi:pirin family protein [Telmatospirillum sp. J64-1]|uniref:pirin family protein n=1 Tax=Telmatospirillum sp. J64-1 TaxID=2502183 RepID=UPI00115E648A|nr:pirin family protein [Telmatospirillum sp. J64-1]